MLFRPHTVKEKVHKNGVLKMVEVTKINGVKILVNPHLFEIVEETPDTVITLTTGRKIIVKESRQEVKNLVKLYRKDIFAE
jgi:flagellar protein FlbD